MQANPVPYTAGSVASTALGVLAAFLVFAVATGRTLPLVAGPRGAFWVLAVIGLAMCGLGGIGRTATTLGWTHPLTLFGIALGVLALALAAAVAAGRTSFLLPLAGWTGSGTAAAPFAAERAAVVALGALMLVKWTVGLAKVFVS